MNNIPSLSSLISTQDTSSARILNNSREQPLEFSLNFEQHLFLSESETKQAHDELHSLSFRTFTEQDEERLTDKTLSSEESLTTQIAYQALGKEHYFLSKHQSQDQHSSSYVTNINNENIRRSIINTSASSALDAEKLNVSNTEVIQRLTLTSLSGQTNHLAKSIQPDNQLPLISGNNALSPLFTTMLNSSGLSIDAPSPLNSSMSTTTPSNVEWASIRIDPSAGKWGEQMMQVLHDRVTLQAQQNMQEAKIRLDPPELGKLELLVRVDGDKLNVQINANTALTREALSQISERLRAELQQQNFVHVEVNIGSEQQDSQQRYYNSPNEDGTIIFAARASEDSESSVNNTMSEHWLNTQA
ncbi:flagellar hook-length control protein FliK [Vibrio metschnikovii]|uniref:flagellar hook-length control protein FliK n=1 Tax=Vibrio metschnikovii TaxID=28172 RepID=UPI002FC6B9EE